MKLSEISKIPSKFSKQDSQKFFTTRQKPIYAYNMSLERLESLIWNNYLRIHAKRCLHIAVHIHIVRQGAEDLWIQISQNKFQWLIDLCKTFQLLSIF